MTKREKKDINYDIEKSFKKLVKLQKMALSRTKVEVKDGIEVEVKNPDFHSAIKIEELKGKLFNLYNKNERENNSITIMGDVKLDDGTTLNLNVGKETDEED